MSTAHRGPWRRPATWIAFVSICVAGVLFTVVYFPRAFPVVSLDIRMDRQAALASADELATRFGWGPENYRAAASFGLQSNVAEFLELEGGGVDAFRDALARDDFHPYRWRVRHFQELERNETTISFAPDGTPYSFREQLAEDAPGAALESDAARVIAERGATGDWDVDLGRYQLLESSQETKPGGRVDHTFVYEETGVRYNDGRVRLRLVVSGDRLTELTRFLEIPEAFLRRYEEMRSTNTLIGAVSQVAAFLGYILGACAVALFFLYRERWVLWKKPLQWGLFIAFLQFLVVFNQLPLAWMGYDTALSSSNFLIQQTGTALLSFLLFAVLFTVTFMAAESMTRRAFPQQVQLWRVWSDGVANTPAIAGRTLGGYLMLGVFFAYEVILYFVANNWLGWWTPSSAVIEPDVLAMYFPWFTAIAVSLQAGFWEECLFRAVPIAGAALLGKRFGHPRAWIVGAFVVQALVFGAGHAPYPTQPAYARVVELIVPSIGFGLIYLYFGLLTGIVLHYSFDIVWFAMPLFASSAPGIWVDRTILLALALIPAVVVLTRRARAGAWVGLPADALNGAWSPPPAPVEEPQPETVAEVRTMNPLVRRLVPVAGLAGLVVWVAFAGFTTQSPPIGIDKATAVEVARTALRERGIELSPEWRTMPVVATVVPNQQHRFVWQEGGAAALGQLEGSYLRVPLWAVRFARFEGDVAERAEEYWVVVGPRGDVFRFVHRLPEARPGADLSEDEARSIAGAAVRERFGLAVGNPTEGGLEEVSAETTSRPARRDWTFTFENPDAYPLEEGSARIRVDVLGDEVGEIDRFVYVPEEWARNDRDRYVLPDALAIAGGAIGVLLVLAGAVAGGVAWARGRFSVRGFLLVAAVVLVLGVFGFINSWPATLANLATSMPIGAQIVVQIAGLSIAVVGMAVVMGLLAGWLRPAVQASGARSGTLAGSLIAGVSMGLLFAALRLALASASPSLTPPWSSFDGADAYLPAIGAALSPLTGWITSTMFLVMVFVVIDRHTGGWSRRTGLAGAVLVVLGILATTNDTAAPLLWLVSGLLLGAAALAGYVFVLRYDLTILPAAVATSLILANVRAAVIAAYPGARAGSAAAIVLLALAAVAAVSWLRGSGLARERASVSG